MELGARLTGSRKEGPPVGSLEQDKLVGGRRDRTSSMELGAEGISESNPQTSRTSLISRKVEH